MEIIKTDKAPAAVGAYSQGIKTGNFIFTSGQLPINPETKELYKEIKEATKQSLLNVEAIVKEAGASKENIVKCTVFLADVNDFEAFNAVYEEFFGEHKPARSAFQVGAVPKGAPLEIEAIAEL
ncbi:MAG: RidA family protein [Anaerococcus sp.]|nr:RidA family protein [Anaerococcus sp.]MDD7044204.1 RidA family protein [Peptoniphilaceae bacterium]MDY2918595.1 RidA family protein [Anaerococcus sp.]